MLVEYCVISFTNLFLIAGGAAIVVISKHTLAQWRLNKPATVPVPVQEKS